MKFKGLTFIFHLGILILWWTSSNMNNIFMMVFFAKIVHLWDRIISKSFI